MKKILTFILSLVFCLALAVSMTACGGHKCEFSEDWTADTDTHYHECIDKDCNKKGDEAPHVYDQKVMTGTYFNAPATENTKATYFYSCVCGAKGTETFNKDKTIATITIADELKNIYDKNYDGNPIADWIWDKSYGDYECDSDGAISVYFKLKDAPDTDYTTTLPIDMGDYVAKIVVAETVEYESCYAVIDFSISPIMLSLKNTISKIYDKTDFIVEKLGKSYGVLDDDDVSIYIPLSSKNVGATILTDSEDFRLIGEDAFKYTFDKASVKAKVYPKTISGINISKQYDKETSITKTLTNAECDMIFEGDEITISLSNIDTSCGTHTYSYDDVTIGGKDSQNYKALEYSSNYTVQIEITPIEVDISSTTWQAQFNGTNEYNLTLPYYIFDWNIDGVSLSVIATISVAEPGVYTIKDGTLTLELMNNNNYKFIGATLEILA